jgi:hypothetical protein
MRKMENKYHISLRREQKRPSEMEISSTDGEAEAEMGN